MKAFIILALLVELSLCEVEIEQKFLKAKSFAEFLANKTGNGNLTNNKKWENNITSKFYKKNIFKTDLQLSSFQLDDAPYYALIYLVDELDGFIYIASGSLIHHEWILTVISSIK